MSYLANPPVTREARTPNLWYWDTLKKALAYKIDEDTYHYVDPERHHEILRTNVRKKKPTTDGRLIYVGDMISMPADGDLGSTLPPNIADAYNERHRFFHAQWNIQHTIAVANKMGLLWCGDPSGHVSPNTELWYAILYHDYVYVPGFKDNEEASAVFAENDLATFLQPRKPSCSQPFIPAVVSRIAQLIRSTAHHDWVYPQADYERMSFLDLDLCALGLPSAAFRAVDYLVWLEYRYLCAAVRPSGPRSLFRIKRREALTGIVRKGSVFHTTAFRDAFEEQARANLEEHYGVTVPSSVSS